MTQIGNDLTELVKAYVAAEPNRSRGGIAALSGFEYQIWSYLADFVLALSSNDLLTGGLKFSHAFETLSDHTRTFENKTICVQVKKLLDRRSMALAGAEFAAIERFLETHLITGLQGQLMYEVVARAGDPSLDWSTIQLPAEIRAREPKLNGYFEKLRNSGRLLTPRFEPDPHWKLIATVYKHLEDPFGFSRRAFELCMRRSQDPSSAAFVREAIAEDYVANMRRSAYTSRILSASDFMRDPGGNGISLAKTPTLRDLRGGRFMNRSKRITAVLNVLEDIGKIGRGLDEPTIPVLWIDGRSGCGKSVLLLEVMEHLVVKDLASVIWFANGTEEVKVVVEQMTKSEEYLKPDFLMVDDIYDPQSRDDLDLPRLTRLIVHSGITTWPILITCGPTEFRQDFERDCRAEGFNVTSWHLGPLEPDETTMLRTWFHSRTGRLSAPGVASTEPHGLMISVVFELEHGDLRPFANRFRHRLVQDQLDGVLSIPLALNRLYIWTPRQWLSADEEERLERLNQDGDFSVLSLEGGGKDVFKLTHPHLSNAIYRALHPESIPGIFARHLVIAFSRALSSHPPTAVRLLRAIASNSSRLEIVDEEELIRGITEAWNNWNKVGVSRGTLAEMWVDWARWNARQPIVGNSLLMSPLETAISTLDSNHPKWTLLWSRLWSCAPGAPTLMNHALEWLPSHFEAAGWFSVWLQVTELAIQYDRGLNITSETAIRLCHIGSEWVKEYPHGVGWSRVWQTLVNAPDFISPSLYKEVIEVGAAWASEYSEAFSWNFVWEKLTNVSHKRSLNLVSDEIYGLGIEWLNKSADHPGWPFVWQHFMALKSLPASVTRAELKQMAITWSSGRENNPGWIFVVRKLIEQETDEAKTKGYDSLITWVEQHLDSPYWHINWNILLTDLRNALTHEQRRRLFIAGCEWINANEEREYLLFVYTQIILNLRNFIDVADEIKLLNGAYDLLLRTVEMEDRGWSNFWFAVSKHLKTWTEDKSSAFLETLLILGRRWIANPAHLSDGTWSQVYRRAYPSHENFEGAHRDLAIRGIVQGLIPDSAALIASLYSTSTCAAPPDELLRWLEQWFGGPASESGGFSIWLRLDRRTRDALIQQPDNTQWMKLRNILDLHRPGRVDSWHTVIEHHRLGLPVWGHIVKTVLLSKWGNRAKQLGYVVDIGINAYLSVEEAVIEPYSESARLAMVGRTFKFDIIRVDEYRLQVDVSRRTLRRRQQEALVNLSIGTIVEGHIKKIYYNGVVVDLGILDGFLDISQIGESPPEHPSEIFELGQHLITKVLDINVAQLSITLTTKN
jgi:hypothetical protein